MRLFIFTLFLTFVWHNLSQGAPLLTPKINDPLPPLDSQVQEFEDLERESVKIHQVQLGYLLGNIYDTNESLQQVFLGYAQKIELDFERYFYFGAHTDFTKFLGINIKTEIKSFDLFYSSFLGNIEVGLIHFINPKDGISNLININHTKLSVGYTLWETLSLHAFFGVYGFGLNSYLYSTF